MKTSSFLRFVPTKPVLFTYKGDTSSDTLPVVLVLDLLHNEDAPGFRGINLNYLKPEDRDYFIRTVKLERETNKRYGLTPENYLSQHLQNCQKNHTISSSKISPELLLLL